MDVEFNTVLAAIVFCLIGAAASYPLLLINGKLAPQLQLMDWPKARGMARVQMPILGYGLVLLAIVLLGVFSHFNYFSPWFLLTATVIALKGHLDDRKPMAARDKLFWQIVCSATVVFFDPNIVGNIGVPFGLTGSLMAIFFIVGLMNAINFIDGIDGLAGLVIMIGLLGAGLYELPLEHHFSHFTFSLLMIGALIPFMYLNIFKRKGFLGNIGSYFFGYCLAVMHLSIPINNVEVIPRFGLTSLCFIVPLSDAIMVIFSRSLTFRSPFRPDKGHLHHRLIQSMIPLRYTLVNFGIVGLAGLMIGSALNFDPTFKASWLPFWCCVAIMAVSTTLILMVEKSSKWRIQSYWERLDRGEPIHFLKYKLKRTDTEPIGYFSLRRLEAAISAEIRVVDLCFAQEPDELMVVIKSLGEPLKRISSRFEPHFHAEKLEATLLSEEGEFIKVSDERKIASLTPQRDKSKATSKRKPTRKKVG